MDQNNFPLLIKNINYGFICILTFGLIGNSLAFLVFSRKKFKNTIFSTYFRFLAVFDTLFFTLIIFNLLKVFEIVNIYFLSIYSCKISFYIIHVTTALSIWTMAIISLDRMFSIVLPNCFQFRTKSINQVIIIIGMIIYNVLVYSPVPFTTNFEINQNITNQNEPKCMINRILIYFELANTTIVPFFLMILSTILTLIKVFRSRKRQSNQHSSSIKNKDIKFAITSISLNLLFLTFNLPVTIFAFFIDYSNEVEKFITTILTLLFQCNYFNLFFVNFIVNNLFRQEFFNMMKRFKVKIQHFFSN